VDNTACLLLVYAAWSGDPHHLFLLFVLGQGLILIVASLLVVGRSRIFQWRCVVGRWRTHDRRSRRHCEEVEEAPMGGGGGAVGRWRRCGGRRVRHNGGVEALRPRQGSSTAGG
jgi:hypothetical protein